MCERGNRSLYLIGQLLEYHRGEVLEVQSGRSGRESVPKTEKRGGSGGYSQGREEAGSRELGRGGEAIRCREAQGPTAGGEQPGIKATSQGLHSRCSYLCPQRGYPHLPEQ